MTHPHLRVILGPPGTGKTTRLLSIVEQELASGVRPDRIGFLSFTRKAASEAVERAAVKFNYKPDQLPFFKTIHSLCFRRLALKPDFILQVKHYRELGDLMGLDLKGTAAMDTDLYGMDAGDRMLFLEGLARVKQCSLQSVYEDAEELDIDYRQLDQLARSLVRYKQNKGLMDYTDMLEEFVRQARNTVPVLDALIVDEAQDLSISQWQVVEVIAARAARVYVAGDDDQAIYKWAGADVDSFMGLGGTQEVLGQSYRVPAKVHAVADTILKRMAKRTPKAWAPRTEQGRVDWYADAEEVDLSTGTWLLLARNGYMLSDLEQLCRRRGISYESSGKDNPLHSPALKAIIYYERLRKKQGITRQEAELVLKYVQGHTGVRIALRRIPADQPTTMEHFVAAGFPADAPIWHQMLTKISPDDREFFIAARRAGETLTKQPRVKISTIHTVKGGEADNVLLLTDMSARTYREMDRRPDDEHRVWYVAVTRARQALHLIQPRTGNCYEL